MLAGVAGLGLSLLAGPVTGSAVPNPVPLEVFAELPVISGPQLSPDGRTVVSRLRKGGAELLFFHDIFPGKSGELRSRSLPLPEATTNWIRWLDDRYVVASVRQFTRISGTDLPYDRLILVDRQTLVGEHIGPKRGSIRGDDVIFWAPDGSFIVLNFATQLFNRPSAIRVDLPSNRLTVLQNGRHGVARWFANSRGEVVGGVGRGSGGRLNVIYRESPRQAYEVIAKLDVLGEDTTGPVYLAGVDADSQIGYLLSRRGRDRWGLYEYDFKSRAYGKTIFASDTADVDDVGFDRNGKLRWVSYVDDRSRMQWLAEEDAEFYRSLEKAVADKVVWIGSASADNQVRLVEASSPTDPGTLYVYTEASGKLRSLAAVSESLGKVSLAPSEYVSFRARDGRLIHAYLTRPLGRVPRALPLVVMPHGGPFARDEWRYDFLVQYLASRGYVVLQPNYRGSTGYGKAFEEAGFQQVGRAMQDDLDDGVHWLVSEGLADPGRVCMVGWSYGGFAAQVAAFRNPDMYRCAISVAGISDFATQLGYDRSFMYDRAFRKWSAKFKGDRDSRSLNGISSLPQVTRIGIPLLLVHGADDNVVPVGQSRRLATALKKAGKTYEYIEIDDGDHSLYDSGQRLQLLKAMETFLARHNPARQDVALRPRR